MDKWELEDAIRRIAEQEHVSEEEIKSVMGE